MDQPSPPDVPSQHVSQDLQLPSGLKQHHSTCTRDLPFPQSSAVATPTDVILEQCWDKIKPSLAQIYTQMDNESFRTHPKDWESMYTAIANLYQHRSESQKLQMFRNVRGFIEEIVTSQIFRLRNLSGTKLLYEYIRCWKFNWRYGKFLKRVFYHLHRFWIHDNGNNLKSDPIRPLDQLIMFYWREKVLTHFHSLVDIAIELVNKSRLGAPVDCSIVRSLVEHFVMLGHVDCGNNNDGIDFDNWGWKKSKSEDYEPRKQAIMHLYQQSFEEPFVAATAEFYMNHGVRIGLPNDVASLLNEIMCLLHKEAGIVRHILHPESLSRVRKATEEKLIGNHVEYLQQEAMKMLYNADYKNLGVVYCLLKRVGKACQSVRIFFVRLVRDKGNSLMVNHASSSTENDSLRHMALVEKLMCLHGDYSQTVTDCFEKSSNFYAAIDDAFRGFINRSMGTISLPVILAHYLNHLLTEMESPVKIFQPGADFRYPDGGDKKADLKGIANEKSSILSEIKSIQEPDFGEEADEDSEDENADVQLDLMDELVRFFLFLDDKDMFCDANRRLFARRLLTKYDAGLEAQFITRLEGAIGGSYTLRFRGMLQDMGTGVGLTAGYAKFVEDKRKVPRDTTCKTIADSGDTNSEEIQAVKSFPAKDRLVKEPTAAVCVAGTPSPSKLDEVSIAKGEGPPRTEKPPPVKMDDLTLAALDLDVTVLILNKLYWPPSTGMALRVPPILTRCQELINEFYMQDRESRTLTWAYGISTVELEARFGRRCYSMRMSTCQGCILMLFNERDEVTIDDMANLTGLSRDEVWQHIQPLLFERKFCVLDVVGDDVSESDKRLKRPPNENENEDPKHVDDAENAVAKSNTNESERSMSRYMGRRLRVNEKFCSVNANICVPSEVGVANAESAVSATEVVVDRTTQMDAAIVRVMKSAKKITHVELSGQVIRLLSPHFQPDARAMKSRIERLIEMEYLSRDQEDARTYHYCA